MNYDPDCVYRNLPFGQFSPSEFMQCVNCGFKGTFPLDYEAGGLGMYVCTNCGFMAESMDISSSPALDPYYCDTYHVPEQMDVGDMSDSELDLWLNADTVPRKKYTGHSYQRRVHINERIRQLLRKDPKISKEHRALIKEYHERLCHLSAFYKLQADQQKLQKRSIQILLRFIDRERDIQKIRELLGVKNPSKQDLNDFRRGRKFECYGSPEKKQGKKKRILQDLSGKVDKHHIHAKQAGGCEL